jgi:sugar O-acyltransferase (sialic acid O-acetyltransferase NeuD family)
MKKDAILIFGAGGHGRVVLDILLESGANIAGFLDDDKEKIGRKIHGFEVLGGLSFLKNKKNIYVALGIGNNKVREKIFRRVKDIGAGIVRALHPRAIVSSYARIGEGVVIMPGAVVNTGTIIEDGAVVNTGATIDHDCHLGSFCQIWPGAHLAGAVRVGEFSYVGTGANVIQNITIGKDVIIGAGAVVISNLPDNSTVVGNPGKAIKKNG